MTDTEAHYSTGSLKAHTYLRLGGIRNDNRRRALNAISTDIYELKQVRTPLVVIVEVSNFLEKDPGTQCARLYLRAAGSVIAGMMLDRKRCSDQLTPEDVIRMVCDSPLNNHIEWDLYREVAEKGIRYGWKRPWRAYAIDAKTYYGGRPPKSENDLIAELESALVAAKHGHWQEAARIATNFGQLVRRRSGQAQLVT